MWNGFKGRHFSPEFILLCVRWYLKYPLSYRQLAEMMSERGIVVSHTTIYRWIQIYAAHMEKLIRWYQGYTTYSWNVDQTYVKSVVNGFTCSGRSIAAGVRLTFILSQRRNEIAARRFLAKALRVRQNHAPSVINTGSEPVVRRCNPQTEEVTNALGLGRPPASQIPQQPTRSGSRRHQTSNSFYARVQVFEDCLRYSQGIEVMRMIRKRQCILLQAGIASEIQFFNKLFGVHSYN